MLLEARQNKNIASVSIQKLTENSGMQPTSHLLMTNSGVYLYVFDIVRLMHDCNGGKTRESLSRWLRSTKALGSMTSVILVGTNSESVRSNKDLLEINLDLRKLTKGLGDVIQNHACNLCFFPIDNETGAGIALLRQQLRDLVKADQKENEQISIRWISLLDRILEERKRVEFVTLTEIRSLVKESDIPLDEIDQVLQWLHEQGFIIRPMSTNLQKQTIVINPQWLIQSIQKIVRDRSLLAADLASFKNVGLHEDWKIMLTKGVASKDLLEYLWGGEQVDFLIDIMTQAMLISSWVSSHERKYLVPCLVPAKTVDSGNPRDYKSEFAIKLSFLPNGLFHRLVSLFVKHSHFSSLVVVDHNICASRVELKYSSKGSVVIEENKESNQIHLRIEGDMDTQEVLQTMASILRKINSDMKPRGKFQWEAFMLDSASGVMQKYKNEVNPLRQRKSYQQPFNVESLIRDI